MPPPTPPQSMHFLSYKTGVQGLGSLPGCRLGPGPQSADSPVVEIKRDSAEIHQTRVQGHGTALPFHLCAPDNLCPPSPRLLDRLPQGFTASGARATIWALSDGVSLGLQPGRVTTGTPAVLGCSVWSARRPRGCSSENSVMKAEETLALCPQHRLGLGARSNNLMIMALIRD